MSEPRGWWRRGGDVVLAVVATVPQLLAVRPGDAGSAPAVLAAAAGLGAVTALVQGAAVLWRRSRPIAALAACAGGYAVQVLTLPGVPPYAGWFVLYAAAVYARPARRAGYATAGGVVVFVGAAALSAALSDGSAGGLVLPAAVTVIVALAGTLVRSRRTQLQALRDRATALERERESAVARAATEERLRIARDLHDLVGHGLSGIAVQAGTARLALDADRPDQARTALLAVEASSRAALTEMRHLVGVLRASGDTDDPARYAPAPGLPDLAALVAQVRDQGTRIELSADGLDGVPGAASVAAYRVVQEAVTNAVRHAPGHRVRVAVRATGGAVHVTVEDRSDGDAPEPVRADAPPGHGLTGMRERAAALGGDLRAGPVDGGWRVTARLPYPGGGTA